MTRRVYSGIALALAASLGGCSSDSHIASTSRLETRHYPSQRPGTEAEIINKIIHEDFRRDDSEMRAATIARGDRIEALRVTDDNVAVVCVSAAMHQRIAKALGEARKTPTTLPAGT